VTRRHALGRLAALGAAVLALPPLITACAAPAGPPGPAPAGPGEPGRPQRLEYGPHPSQFGELTLPAGDGPVRGVVVVVHGGFWRQAYGLELGRPLAEDLFAWLSAQLARLPGGSPTAKAIRYALNHRDGLVRFLDDGRIELDTNTVERAIRPLVLSRKNALFASGDDGGARWATVASLVETCKLNGVDPQRYFTDLLTRLVNGWPNSRIDELMPWKWTVAETG